MAITKRPNSNHKDIQTIDKEQAAQSFIDQLTDLTQLKRQNKIPIMLRFDPKLLAKIDSSAKKRGISRSSWIHFILSKILEEGEL